MKKKYGTIKIKTKDKNEDSKWVKTLRTFGGSTGHGFEKIKK